MAFIKYDSNGKTGMMLMLAIYSSPETLICRFDCFPVRVSAWVLSYVNSLDCARHC